jgi:hypothetical protein
LTSSRLSSAEAIVADVFTAAYGVCSVDTIQGELFGHPHGRSIIKRNAERLTDRTLDQLNMELTDEAKRYERMYKGKTTSNYGWECDRDMWLEFHGWVKDEIEKRNSR